MCEVRNLARMAIGRGANVPGILLEHANLFDNPALRNIGWISNAAMIVAHHKFPCNTSRWKCKFAEKLRPQFSSIPGPRGSYWIGGKFFSELPCHSVVDPKNPPANWLPPRKGRQKDFFLELDFSPHGYSAST